MAKLSTTMMLLVAGVALMSAAAAYFINSAPSGNARIQLMPNDIELVSLGGAVYAQNCAACHGAALQGQAACAAS
jgi:mono/diheme cytochrome c family protein